MHLLQNGVDKDTLYIYSEAMYHKSTTNNNRKIWSSLKKSEKVKKNMLHHLKIKLSTCFTRMHKSYESDSDCATFQNYFGTFCSKLDIEDTIIFL